MVLGFACVAVGSDGATHGASAVHVEDRSSFDQFEFTRLPGLGFCPPVDRLFSAALEAEPWGGLRLRATRLERGAPGVDACLPDYIGDADCVVERPLVDRVLTALESRRVRGVFSAVPVLDSPDPVCAGAAVDPCEIAMVRWDATTLTDYVCSAPRCAPQDIARFVALLEGLALGLPLGCAGDCDGDGVVMADEVVRAVRIALGMAALDECAAADRDGDTLVTIEEVVAAVAATLNGCDGM